MDKIKFFLDDGDELLPSDHYTLIKTEHFPEGYSLITVYGALSAIIVKSEGMYKRPKGTIFTNGFTFITSWNDSLL